MKPAPAATLPPCPVLAGAAFEAAFPFHVLLDPAQRVWAAGAGIQRAVPGLQPGVMLHDWLVPTRPRGMDQGRDWRAFDGLSVVLRGCKAPAPMFRGQLFTQGSEGSTLLLLTPVVTRLDDLRQLGLQLGDLAVHDATGDMLLLQQALQTSLDDAQRLAQRLRTRGQQLQWMTELSGHGVAYFDADGVLLQHNPLFTRLLDWPGDAAAPTGIEAVTSHVRALLIPTDADRLDLSALAEADAQAQAAASPVAPPALVVMTRAGAHLRLRYRNAGSDAHVLYIRDVTAETQLDRMKTEFMTTAAHELRTPMTSIYGFSEMLAKRELQPDRVRSVAETIHRQASWMVSLLNEVLDLARLEARQGSDFLIEPVPMAEWIEEVTNSYCDAAAQARLRMQLNAEPQTLLVDRLKAGQALGNVLSNAFKYSPQGGPVSLDARAQALGERAGVALRVRDSGIGMTETQLERVFERFYRADPSGNIPGSGLGMSLVQQIVHLHGGTVHVSSQPGHGTEVTLWLPAAVNRS